MYRADDMPINVHLSHNIQNSPIAIHIINILSKNVDKMAE